MAKIISGTDKKQDNRSLHRGYVAPGLRKMNSVRIHDDNPVIRGMIKKVIHLVEVKEIKE